jgi:hypothetical protein
VPQILLEAEQGDVLDHIVPLALLNVKHIQSLMSVSRE